MLIDYIEDIVDVWNAPALIGRSCSNLFLQWKQ